MVDSWPTHGGESEETVEPGTEEFYEILAWVKASERKKEVLQQLDEGPRNSTDFMNDWDVTYETVRYHLKPMMDGKERPPLVEELTPNRKRGKLYGLSELGELIVEYL